MPTRSRALSATSFASSRRRERVSAAIPPSSKRPEPCLVEPKRRDAATKGSDEVGGQGKTIGVCADLCHEGRPCGSWFTGLSWRGSCLVGNAMAQRLLALLALFGVVLSCDLNPPGEVPSSDTGGTHSGAGGTSGASSGASQGGGFPTGGSTATGGTPGTGGGAAFGGTSSSGGSAGTSTAGGGGMSAGGTAGAGGVGGSAGGPVGGEGGATDGGAGGEAGGR